MKKLLWEIWKYEGSASSAALFYDAKVREALCLIFEHHRKLNEKTKATISSTDTQLLNSLGLYINDHFAELFSNAKGLLPLSYRKAFQKSHF